MLLQIGFIKKIHQIKMFIHNKLWQRVEEPNKNHKCILMSSAFKPDTHRQGHFFITTH